MIGPNHERHCLNGFASDALNHLHGGVDGQIFGRLKILRFEAFQVAGCGVPGGCGGVCAGASVAARVVIRPPVRWEAELGFVPGDVTADRSVLCSTPGELFPSLAAAGSVVASVVAPGR